jgi:hypothetical protein
MLPDRKSLTEQELRNIAENKAFRIKSQLKPEIKDIKASIGLRDGSICISITTTEEAMNKIKDYVEKCGIYYEET